MRRREITRAFFEVRAEFCLRFFILQHLNVYYGFEKDKNRDVLNLYRVFTKLSVPYTVLMTACIILCNLF